jgi:magnesium chelatase family protein
VNIIQGASFYLVGLPDSAVKESQFRIESTFKSNNFRMPGRRIIVNMAPADLKKEGSAYDLPLAVGILAASGQILCPDLEKYLIMGELSLDGGVKPIKGVLPIAIEARKEGFKGFILPVHNAREAAVVNNLDVIGVENISQAVDFLTGKQIIEPTVVDTRNDFFTNINDYDVDFFDVKGQENVKRALEIAASGSHNILIMW